MRSVTVGAGTGLALAIAFAALSGFLTGESDAEEGLWVGVLGLALPVAVGAGAGLGLVGGIARGVADVRWHGAAASTAVYAVATSWWGLDWRPMLITALGILALSWAALWLVDRSLRII